MACHETKYCPRCKQAFECKPGNITQCQCYGLAFTEQEKEYIGATYKDCLCRSCLDTMKYEIRYKEIELKRKAILSGLNKKDPS